MNFEIRRFQLALLLAVPLFLGADWLQFRGSDNRGVAVGEKLPVEFGPEQNVAWKVALPGDGVCGPIVIGNRVVVSASSGAVEQDRLHVLSFDTTSGKQLWHRQFWATGRPYHHPTSANAAPTPASDGQRIFAFYSSNDLVCLDLDGNLLWYRGLGLDYPKTGNDVGMSASPLVVGETVVVQVECQGDSFAAGLDTATGENRWRVNRPKGANWVSPAAIRGAAGNVVLLQSANGLTAHDSISGKELWKFEASCAGIASLTTSGDRIFLPSKGLTVLESPDGASTPKLLWESNKLSPGNASPVIDGDRVYVLNRVGVLTCADAVSGKTLWQTRLKGTFWATPVIADGYAYCANQDGECHVVKLGGGQRGSRGDLVHTAAFTEPFFGTPAVAGGALFLRSEKSLWKIASPK